MDSMNSRGPVVWLFLLAAASFLTGMGIAPLFLEEPRRALVAMEMLYSGDYIHTTIHGAAYYNKPPLFNWLVAAGFKLFGYHEWVLRLIANASHMLTGYLVYRVAKRYMGNHAGLLSAGLYLVGADILLYFSLIGEIDLFFSLLVVAGWFTYFHFTESKKHWAGYLLFYLCMALCFLTKGLPAVVFIGCTLLGWLAWNRNLKALFLGPNFFGFALFLAIVGLYFYPFLVKGDMDTLVSTLLSQSLERTTAESNIGKRILSLFTFPVFLLKDIFPAALLLLLYKNGLVKKAIATNRLVAFCLVVFVANIWVYWISPNSASRYLYMFHPLLIIPLVWLYQSSESNGKLKLWVDKTFRFLPWFFTGILLVGIFLVPLFLKTKGIIWVLPLAFLAAALLLFTVRKQQWNPVYQTVMVLLVVRFAYGFITVSERSQGSQAAKDKAVAKEMAQVVQEQPVYLFDSTRISYTISFYLQKELGRVVGFKKNVESGDRLIMPDSLLQTGMQVEKTFLYKGNPYSMALVK